MSKRSFEMLRFFKDRLRDGRLRAYADRSGQLVSVDDLEENRSYELVDPSEIKYRLAVESSGGMFSTDGDQDHYHTTTLERFSIFNYSSITARLVATTTVHWVAESDHDGSEDGGTNLNIEGKPCELFRSFSEYIRLS